jgi:hypothetical protein
MKPGRSSEVVDKPHCGAAGPTDMVLLARRDSQPAKRNLSSLRGRVERRRFLWAFSYVRRFSRGPAFQRPVPASRFRGCTGSLGPMATWPEDRADRRHLDRLEFAVRRGRGSPMSSSANRCDRGLATSPEVARRGSMTTADCTLAVVHARADCGCISTGLANPHLRSTPRRSSSGTSTTGWGRPVEEGTPQD